MKRILKILLVTIALSPVLLVLSQEETENATSNTPVNAISETDKYNDSISLNVTSKTAQYNDTISFNVTSENGIYNDRISLNATSENGIYNDSISLNVTSENGKYNDIISNSSNNTICGGTSDSAATNCSSEATAAPVKSTVQQVITYIGYITVPIFLVMSLSGNCLTLIIMFSTKFWNTPCSLLLIALALSDSTYSIVFPFSKLFVRDLVGYDLRALTEIGCNLFFIIHKCSKMCSSWFIVAICIERFIAIWFPLKAKIICSKKNTLVVIIIITGGMLIFTGLWTFSTHVVNGICVPNYATPATAFMAKTYLIAGSLVFSLIPAVILIIITPATCYKLHVQSKLRKTLSKSRSVDTTRVNAMLLGITIAYIILVTPTAVVHNVCFTLNINFYESRLLFMSILRGILQVAEQLNFSINFWLYVMCNRSFRNRTLDMLCCRSSLSSWSGSSHRTVRTTRSLTASDMGRSFRCRSAQQDLEQRPSESGYSSPKRHAASLKYSNGSPKHNPASPKYSNGSPKHIPASPKYSNGSPKHIPASPKHSNGSPKHNPGRSEQSNGSPKHIPASPTHSSESSKHNPATPKHCTNGSPKHITPSSENNQVP